MIKYCYVLVINTNFPNSPFGDDSDLALNSKVFDTLEECCESAYVLTGNVCKFLDPEIITETEMDGEGDDSWSETELFRIVALYAGEVIGQTRVFEIEDHVSVH